MTAGLTPEGFVAATVEELVADLEAAQRAALGANINTTAEGVIGALNAGIGTKLGQVWELGEIVSAARDPNGATFAALDGVCAITGTQREAATYGRVTLSLSLNAGVTVPAGKRVSAVGQPTNLWQLTEAAVNSGGSPAVVQVPARATRTGRILANAGQLSVIATPVTGWTAVTNAEDAESGAPAESDPALRTRREAELFRAGTSPLDAIYADLADVAVDGTKVVASLTVTENASAFTDALGRPPHTIEAVVQFLAGLAGDDLTAARQAVAQRLWVSKAGGPDTTGDHSATAIDARGDPRTVRWTEPTLVSVWVDMVLSIDPVLYDASSSHAAAKAVVIAYGEALRLGRDVVRQRLASQLMALAGVVDIIELNIGTTLTSTSARNVPVGPRELASFDTGRIAVTTEIASEP